MKLNITFLRTLVLLVVGITIGSSDSFAQQTAPWTVLREWDFNNVAFQFGRYSDPNSLLNHPAAAEDWEKVSIDMQIQKAYWNDNDELVYENTTITRDHAFSRHAIVNHQIQGGQYLYLTAGQIFGSLMDNIVFNAPAGCFGFCNEAETSSAGVDVQDRYIALKAGASFTLTDLQEGDWVVIKMDRNVGTAKLKITGAKDALENTISSDDYYGIGGCQWFNNGNASRPNYHWRGEYHFKATGGEMTFNFTPDVNGQTLKLYNIKLYRNYSKFPSENSIVCSKHYGQTFLWTYNNSDSNKPADYKGNYELHYRGKNEKSELMWVRKNGNLYFTKDNFTQSSDSYHFYLESQKGDWGIFKLCIASKEHGNKYYTDYAERICSQSYLNKAEYPCTWDFTDLIDYFDDEDHEAWKENPANLQDQDPDLAFWKLEGDFNGEHKYNFQMGVDKYGEGAGHNAQYVNGGELHLANHDFLELEGLGVSAFNWGGHNYNDQLKISKDGIELSSDAEKPFKFIVPEIGGDTEKAAVYVRVKKNASGFVAKAQVGSSLSDMEEVGNDGDEYVYKTSQITTNDWVTLQLTGCTVKKIAVTKDFKDVNSYGYSTESRTRAIDHSLTPYFTAGKIKAYSVSDVDYDNSKIVLAEVKNILPAASANGDEGRGVILYNKDETSVSGFGLFVADVHDTETLSDGNMLCANLTQNNNIGKNSDGKVNYLLNAQGTNVVTGEPVYGIAFYKASKTAKLGPNKAYLPMNSSAGAKMSMVFADEEVENSEATGITVVNSKRTEDNAYYTLSGVKVERPTKSGIYIKNGKKVIIK